MNWYNADIKNSEIDKRIQLSYQAISNDRYNSQNIFSPISYEWQGDMEGRAILAMVSLYRATGQENPFLKEIIEKLPTHLNEQGYFGNVQNLQKIDEQQLSGNGWFLRALCDYYETFQENNHKILNNINLIVENLYLPLYSSLDSYPGEEERFSESGKMIGEREDGTFKNWLCSTDIGCLYISLDGLTAAYKITQKKELRALIDKMIKGYLKLNFEKYHYQTHAMLSGLRGLLRYYEISADQNLLVEIENRFHRYIANGTTLNDANQNWFGIPKWTESCAIIDSYIIAAKLYHLTNRAEYITFMNRVYYNAISFAQRSTGAFGCDSCLISNENKELKVIGYDAYWCCTMRGGEFALELVKNLFVEKYDDQVEVLTPHNIMIHAFDNKVIFEISGKFPFGNDKKLTVIKNELGNIKVSLFTYSLNCSFVISNGHVKNDKDRIVWEGILTAGDTINIKYDAEVKVVSIGKDKIYKYGILLLGQSDFGYGKKKEYNFFGKKLYPVINQIDVPIEEGAKVVQSFKVIDN